MGEFLQAYEGTFDAVDNAEKEKLLATANWMALLAQTLPAKRNKGLYMHVVPKLVEGFDVKYTLGTGQSKQTSRRAAVFEREGGVKAGRRKVYVQIKKDPSEKKPVVKNLFCDPLPPAAAPSTESASAQSTEKPSSPSVGIRKCVSSSSDREFEIKSVFDDEEDMLAEAAREAEESGKRKAAEQHDQRSPRGPRLTEKYSFVLIDSLGDKNYIPSFEISTAFELNF